MMDLKRSMRVVLLLTLMLGGGSFVKASPFEPEAVPGEYLVKVSPELMQLSFASLGTSLGGEVIRSIPEQNILIIKRSGIELQSFGVKTLNQNLLVERAEPNYIYRALKTPNDLDFSKLWGLKNIGQPDSSKAEGVEGVDIKAEEAWDITTGSSDVVVAVIDTGINHAHEDLKENMWVNDAELKGEAGVDDDKNGFIDDIYGYDFVNNDGDPMDDHGHGSHCAGTIGAKGDDGKGIVGVAWNVKLMGLKFLSRSGSGSLEDAIKAINYATQMGAHIMSNSWGGGPYSDLLKASIEAANEKNILFVAAAGNHSGNNDKNPTYPASYDVPNVLAVAAVNNRGQMASFSCYGKKSVHVGAPGVNIYSSTLKGYDSWSGTSMATPHVSGVAALLWSHEPNLTAVEVKARLMRSATPLLALKGRVASGGMVNAYNALTNQVAPPDVNDPENWPNRQSLNISTTHPYPVKHKESWEVEIQDAKEISLYFEKFETERAYDKVKFYDRDNKFLFELHGDHNQTWTPIFKTNYVRIEFISDDSVARYGFDLTQAAWR